MSEQFGAKPFYAGTVVGLRAFSIFENTLCSPQVEHDWIPGENVAVCPDSCTGSFEPHSLGGMNGRCGFYAYFDGSNTYARPNRITGIIEGYGTVTIGHRGFRASKARIVALVRPSSWRLSGRDYAFPESPFPDTIAATYPGVPWYDTEADAISAHPLTNPSDLGVEVPEEPDFSGIQNRFSQGGIIRGPGVASWHNPHMHHVHVNIGVDVSGFVKAMKRAAKALRSWGGTVADVEASLRRLNATMGTEPTDPVERKRQLAEQRAQQRAQAGLSGSGGFDRRGRRR